MNCRKNKTKPLQLIDIKSNTIFLRLPRAAIRQEILPNAAEVA